MSLSTPGSPAPPPASGYNAAVMEDLHRNIALANTYRMELIKLVMAISAALLAFTVTLRPMIEVSRWEWLMWTGWGGLVVAMVGGALNMAGWDCYYMSYRDIDHKLTRSGTPYGDAAKAGKVARKAITAWRRCATVAQLGGFAVGVAAVAGFAAANFDSPRRAEGTVAASVQAEAAPTPARPLPEVCNEKDQTPGAATPVLGRDAQAAD